MATHSVKLALALALSLLSSGAWAQCNGVFPNNTACGNISGSGNLPRPIPLSSFPANAPGGVSGNVQTNNGAGGFAGITNTQLTALLDIFTSALRGAVPASGGGTVNFLRADGTWATPPGTGVTTVTSSGLATGSTGPAATVVVTAATKADQETGTSTTTVVTPANQKNNDSAMKANGVWVSGGLAANAFNITSITAAGTGVYNVVFTTAFASATGYGCVVTAGAAGLIASSVPGSKTTTNFRVDLRNDAGTNTNGDFYIACWGRQ